MINHLSTQALVDAIGCFSEQKGLETPQHTFQDRHNHQSDTQNLQCVETALTDHLVDDHLDQQRVGQSEQLDNKARSQNLDQNSAIPLQRRPEPARAEFLIRRGIGALHQQQLNPLRETLSQVLRSKGHQALPGRSQFQALLTAGHHQSEAPLPGEHGWHLQAGARIRRHLRCHDMQSEAGGQLPTKLKVRGQTPTDVVLQNLFDGIPPERQLHQLRQHLETGERLLNGAVSPNHTQAVDHVAFRTEAAHRWKQFGLFRNLSRD